MQVLREKHDQPVVHRLDVERIAHRAAAVGRGLRIEEPQRAALERGGLAAEIVDVGEQPRGAIVAGVRVHREEVGVVVRREFGFHPGTEPVQGAEMAGDIARECAHALDHARLPIPEFADHLRASQLPVDGGDVVLGDGGGEEALALRERERKQRGIFRRTQEAVEGQHARAFEPRGRVRRAPLDRLAPRRQAYRLFDAFEAGAARGGDGHFPGRERPRLVSRTPSTR